MEINGIENLIKSTKLGDIKAFEKLYNATFTDIASRLDHDSAKMEAAYIKMISTIGAVENEKHVNDWIDKAVDFAISQETSKAKKISKHAVYKKIIASKEAEVRFKLNKTKRFFAGLTSLQKSMFMIAAALILAVVIILSLSGSSDKPMNTYQIEQTTLPGNTAKVENNQEDPSVIEGLCVYSPDGEYLYYSSDGCVRKMDREGNNDVIVAYGNAYSMTIHKDLLYFISNGKIFCVNTKNDQMVNQVKTKGNLLCYNDNRFFSIDTRNGIIYALGEDLKPISTTTVKSTHLKYKDGYIYYYQEGTDHLVRQQLSLPIGKAQIISSGKDKNGMRFGYQINGNQAVIPTFDSDKNGELILVDLKKKKSKSIKLEKYFEDFALAGNRIIYSSYRLGTYICDIDGKNSKKIDNACLYFVNSCGNYYAFNNLADGTTVIYSSKTGKFDYTIKADVDSMEILGDFMIYNCDGKMTKVRLSDMKNGD